MNCNPCYADLKTSRQRKNNVFDLPHTKIVSLVCSYYGVNEKKILSSCRERNIVDCRITIFYIMRNYFGLTFSSIGKFFDRDHTTVIHGCASFQNYLNVDGVFKKRTEYLFNLLNLEL